MPTEIRAFVNACTTGTYLTGIPAYAREIAAALARRHDTTVHFASREEQPEGTLPVRPPLKHRQLWTQFQVPRLMRSMDANVYLGTEYSAPVFTRLPRVVMVHDLAHRTMPKLYTRGGLLHVRMLFETLKRADRLLVPTAAVAGDVVRYLGFPAGRVHVVPEAPRTGFGPVSPESVAATSERLGIARPYLLGVGVLNRHKRTIDAIRALALLRDRGCDVELVLAGPTETGLLEHYHRASGRLGVAEAVRFLGHVPDDDLAALYAGAVALVFPSIMEGFGIPPLEAMACGAPVIAADIPVLRENLEGAALLVPPRNPAAIAGAAMTLLTSASAREEWVGRGRERATQFSWDRAAAQTADVFRQLL
ncbi:MAG: glycosyltransferase family 4 protein [Chloroflexi bacterium]|nr:glycosyltransferase family 4 protein [Chloroflexota bacterium]